MIFVRQMARILVVLALFAGFRCWSEELTFQHAIQLALQHSPAIGVAMADQLKAAGSYRETFNQYKPNVTLGSGVGYSFGFPLSLEGSAPSIFNVNYSSVVYSPALKDFLKSAKLQWTASTQSTEDSRKDVVLDTALTYIQLDKLLAEVKLLATQQAEADNFVTIETQRVQQGVDSDMDLTRAKLVAARGQMQIAQVQGNADVLRAHLAQLTGFPADVLTTNTESIPKLPDVDQKADMVAEALSHSGAVKAADERAQAETLRAKGEWKDTYYPSFSLGAQYGLFSNTLNSYSSFYRNFQQNNASFGMVVRFPIFNFVQHARADEAAADALKAKSQAAQVKEQVSSQALQLQRSVRQLAAANEVARLEYQLAQSEEQSTQIRAEQGAPPPPGQQAPAVSARDVANAKLAVGDKYSQYIDSSFELDKARLQLLRVTGQLENWALHGK